MNVLDRIVALGKKYFVVGVIAHVVVTAVAAVVALFEAAIVFIVGVAYYFPMGKYGSPVTAVPVVKYGAPAAPTPDQFLPSISTPESIFTVLVILGSLLLYAWTILGWVFWGGILYLKRQDKKKKM